MWPLQKVFHFVLQEDLSSLEIRFPQSWACAWTLLSQHPSVGFTRQRVMVCALVAMSRKHKCCHHCFLYPRHLIDTVLPLYTPLLARVVMDIQWYTERSIVNILNFYVFFLLSVEPWGLALIYCGYPIVDSVCSTWNLSIITIDGWMNNSRNIETSREWQLNSRILCARIKGRETQYATFS